jgi:hypothetical protein
LYELSNFEKQKTLPQCNKLKAKQPRPEVYNEARCEGFMWLRTVDIGAHQVCCPLLQALFMTAKAPTMSTVTVRMINTEVFIATSPLRAPTPTDPDFSWFKMNPL